MHWILSMAVCSELAILWVWLGFAGGKLHGGWSTLQLTAATAAAAEAAQPVLPSTAFASAAHAGLQIGCQRAMRHCCCNPVYVALVS
jgi:hypothetical protein